MSNFHYKLASHKIMTNYYHNWSKALSKYSKRSSGLWSAAAVIGHWFARGGYAAPVVIPATPGSVLLHRMRAVAELEKNPKLRLRICERGGVQLSRQLMRSNVTQTGNCGDTKCPIYNQKGCGSICRKSNNINYQYSCQLPPCKPADSEESSSSNE